MDAHLQAQALMLTLGAKIAHRLAHANRSGNGAVSAELDTFTKIVIKPYQGRIRFP